MKKKLTGRITKVKNPPFKELGTGSVELKLITLYNQ
jgi:hypothetical protein